MVYAVSVRGDVDGAHARLSAQPWVDDITLLTRGDTASWRVEVSDRDSAETNLLNVLLTGGRPQVLSWGPLESDLESYFVELAGRAT